MTEVEKTNAPCCAAAAPADLPAKARSGLGRYLLLGLLFLAGWGVAVLENAAGILTVGYLFNLLM